MVLEDDPYGLLRFEGEDLPTLRELGAGRVRVVSVRTFSKILAPGLRVGWVEAEPEIVARMIDARQAMDTCTAPPMQRLVSRFLAEGHADAHLATLRGEYRRRKIALQHALHDEFAGLGASWTDPHGGFFLWLTLPAEIDTEALFDLALEEGVAFIPGPAFSIGGRFSNALPARVQRRAARSRPRGRAAAPPRDRPAALMSRVHDPHTPLRRDGAGRRSDRAPDRRAVDARRGRPHARRRGPATGDVLAAVADASPSDGRAALDAADGARERWAATPARERARAAAPRLRPA